MSAHATTQDAHEQAGPSVRTLARLLGLRKTDYVARFMLQLEVIGAVDVVRPTRTLDRHNRYVVHQTPPSTYRGPASLDDFYALSRPQPDETSEEQYARENAVDAWLAAVRAALKDHCKKVTADRAAARKALQPIPPVEPFQAPSLADFRLTTHAVPRQRTSIIEERAALRIAHGWGGNPYDDFCPEGVDDPALELGPFEPVYPGTTPPRVSEATRRAVFERDGHRCLECGSTEDLTVDHIQHQCNGGGHKMDNLRTLCRSCNSRRGAGYLPGVDA
ncbi:HNH endonuclease [Streptomyces pseudogriseolus]|uniref:HNH endonuclease n=1 Tax=Streptomyces pseudogriseolus TaxID=36817 RepID=UPI003FA1EFB3